MSKYKVLVTDYAWPDLEIEKQILAEVDAEIIQPASQSEADIVAAAKDAHAILTNWATVSRAAMENAAECRIVCRLGIGLDNIDVAAATDLGMRVTNVPDYCLVEVAEHTLAMILSLARNLHKYHLQTKNGQYDLQAGQPLLRIQGKTLGLLGLGNTGLAVASRAAALGMKVLATRRSSDPVENVTIVPLEQMLAESDYVSLHAPLTDETKHIINAQTLAHMKPTASIINTARGGLIDHTALTTALQSGKLAGAALDVHEPEPAPLDQAPWNLENVLVTPHAAFYAPESIENLRVRTAKQAAAQLTGGTPENIVNGL